MLTSSLNHMQGYVMNEACGINNLKMQDLSLDE